MEIIYDGGRQNHMTTSELRAYMERLVEFNHGLPMDEQREMSDAAAQTVAAMWHSPGNPASTLLSTMGQVSDEMRMSDLASLGEYHACDAMDKLCLDYLMTYILRKQLGD